VEMEAVSGAALVALASAVFFTLLARGWQVLVQSLSGNGYFADFMTTEAAQRFRDQLTATSRRQSILLSSALVFMLAFAATYLLAPDRFSGHAATWQLVTTLAVLSGSVAYALYRVTSNFLCLRRLSYLRDAHRAIGHGLQKMAGNLNRVFHEVRCGDGVIDNVLAGVHGVYAIYVIARKAGKRNKVRLRGDRLQFAPGQFQTGIADYLLKSERLARKLRKALKHDLRVRTVIAVPGWDIEEQANENCLVVNERNLVMLGGWKDREDYLMNEDVELLHELLSVRAL